MSFLDSGVAQQLAGVAEQVGFAGELSSMGDYVRAVELGAGRSSGRR